MPHFAVEVFPDQLAGLVANSEAPERCWEELHIVLIGDEATTGERNEAAREEIFKTWYDLNLEDMSILECLQQGRKCSSHDGGRLSPRWEHSTLGYASKIIEMVVAS